MDHRLVDTSGSSDLDLDIIDLESGGTTSGEDSNRSQLLSCKNPKNLLGVQFMNSESQCGSTNDGDHCSCSYDKLMISDDEISAEHLGKYWEEMMVNKTMMNEENPKKNCKPPRPPKGPSLDASDMKLLKEITVLNLKRKRMERRRTLKKIIRKDKASSSSSSWKTNLLACLVTIVFLLVIVFQGLLGSRI